MRVSKGFKIDNYLGKKYVLRSGITVKIIDYKGYHNVTVQTLDGNGDIINCEISQLTKGNLNTPHTIVAAGVGYIGVGEYKPRPKGRPKSTAYNYWSNMLTRVYRYQYKAYKDVVVDDVWHNFQNYAQWFYVQEGCDLGWHVDKDLIGSGLKYSDSCCVMVPKIINQFAQGIYYCNGLLPGVHINVDGKYKAQLSNSVTGKRESLGVFSSEYEAFEVYKRRKEDHLVELLNSNKCENMSDRLKTLLIDKFEVRETRRLNG